MATDQLELELELEPADPDVCPTCGAPIYLECGCAERRRARELGRRRSPNERYGPFPDGMDYVVWRTLALWELADWWRARAGAG